MTLQTPLVLARDEGEHHHFLNNLFTTKVDGERSGGALTCMEFIGPKDFGPPLHSHDIEDELFYVVEGRLWFSCGGIETEQGPGAVVWLPKGLPHQFQILSDTARVLQLTTPAQFEELVRTLGEPAQTPTLPVPTEVDGARVAQVCADFQIQVLGPPPAPRT